ncbi:hypothetical protein ACLOJK_000608 [Asimina triloba]
MGTACWTLLRNTGCRWLAGNGAGAASRMDRGRWIDANNAIAKAGTGADGVGDSGDCCCCWWTVAAEARSGR